MGRTLFGIDLDESPASGLLRRLLSEDDLRKLDLDDGTAADGGTRPAARPDGGDDTAADETTQTDLSGRAVPESDAGDGQERAEPAAPAPEGGDDESEGSSRFARLRSLLVPAVVALAVLAAVALLVWRYGDAIRAAVSNRLGRGDDTPSGTGDTASDGAPPTFEARETVDAGTDADADGETETGGDEGDRDALTDDTVESDQPDSDIDALVGLAFLALVAALVRHLTEQREHDPLVDGDRE